MSARVERIAYQIWWLIDDTAGECTLQDMVAFTGASKASCSQICRYRGWTGNFRNLPPRSADHNSPEGIAMVDDALACPIREVA